MALLQVAIVFATAFLVTFCTVPLSRKIAVVLGAIDQPGYRRVNKGPVPRCGGIALYLGLCAAFLVAYVGLRFFGWQPRDLYTLNGINCIELFVGITVMFAVGLVDDVTRLSPKMKLLGQIIAACIVVASGVSIGMVPRAISTLISTCGLRIAMRPRGPRSSRRSKRVATLKRSWHRRTLRLPKVIG